MNSFMDDKFLLRTETAEILYHKYAEKLPLFDYHCHLPVREIAENKPFNNIGELWLGHDHYKWRLMRSCGIPEELITGNAGWYEKFLAFASALPYAIGNPIYHWTHMELKKYFNIDLQINAKNAQQIWDATSEMISSGKFTPWHFIEASNVETICTTDDPADSLEYHLELRNSSCPARVLPAWRPDKALKLDESGYADYIARLSENSGVSITDFTSLLSALTKRMDAFEEAGCFASDHDMPIVFSNVSDVDSADAVFRKAIGGEHLENSEIDLFKATLLYYLAKEYQKRDWAMELHVGCNRNVNQFGVNTIGRSSGFDSPGDYELAEPLGKLLSRLNSDGILPKTILFCMNPKDNWVIASLVTTFQSEGIPSRIQFGTAWWMQDHIPGMLAQMEALSNTGVFGHFIGMLTDSRSYLSYTRFDYFRRILCNYIGNLVESGQYPFDEEMLGEIVSGISFYNAKKYFQSKGANYEVQSISV